MAAYERRERGLLEAVEALDRSAAMLERDVERARSRAVAALHELDAVEAEADRLSARLADTREAMRARSVALYKAGEAGAVRMLFASGGIREFLSRVQSLRLLLSHDAELLARHREQSEALEAARDRAGEAAIRHGEAASSLEERSQQLASERRLKQKLARELRRDRARERSALVELETAARALEETLASLREPEGADPTAAAQPPGPPFASLRGRLPAPVEGALVERFGRVVDPRYRTETFRKGVAFEAPAGTPVAAVAAATVRFAGWFRGYGRLVILDHGEEWFSVSGHLSEIRVEVGDAVAAGQRIGSVGETGSLAGPRLYFEIRRAGEPVNPVAWLGPLDARPPAG